MSKATVYSFVLIAVHSHISVLALLSVRRSELPPSTHTSSSTTHSRIPTTLITCLGFFSAAITLTLPYISFPDDPYVQSLIRCVCYFYTCKILDLSIAKAESPPSILQLKDGRCDSQELVPIVSLSDHAKYIYLLLTEMRYPSFDIAVKQKGRPVPSKDDPNTARDWLPPYPMLISAIILPKPELISLAILIIIQCSFEALHSILHFSRTSCTQPLFYKTFTAGSFASFWGTHWHAVAAPFLQTLAYRPGRKHVGKWFGVLATFNLTGLWHAWAVIPFIEPESKVVFGLEVWGLFMMWGVGILVERLIWGESQGGVVQRIVVWLVSILGAGQCVRSFECRTQLDWLRSDRCASPGPKSWI